MSENNEYNKEKNTSSKLNNIQVVFGMFITLITTCVVILFGSGNGMLQYILPETIEVVDCKYSVEEHIVEKLERYEVEIEPSDKMARVALQGYIEVIYEDKRQVILLDELFTQRTYVMENGKFPILKRVKDEELCKNIRNKVEEKLNERGTSKVIVNTDTLMCFAYSEELTISYYLLNNSHPEKIDDADVAREKVTSKIGIYTLDVTCCEEADIEKIVEEIVEELQ